MEGLLDHRTDVKKTVGEERIAKLGGLYGVAEFLNEETNAKTSTARAYLVAAHKEFITGPSTGH